MADLFAKGIHNVIQYSVFRVCNRHTSVLLYSALFPQLAPGTNIQKTDLELGSSALADVRMAVTVLTTISYMTLDIGVVSYTLAMGPRSG